jgi:DNA invertase Pin-like site-specific DNA recombinase
MTHELLSSTAAVGAVYGYGYIRFSSEEQSEGDSERRQLEGITAAAEKYGLKLIMLPTDRAVSAHHGNNLRNGSLAKFTEDARAGRIPRGSWLLFEDFDRFSRAEAPVAGEHMFALVNLGIVICTTSDGRTCRSGSDVTDFIIPLIKMQGAYDDNIKRARRVKKTLEAKRALASRDSPLTGRVPEWLEVIEKHDGKKVSRRIEEQSDRADIVRYMFDLSASGWGDGTITRKLNSDSVTAFKDGSWQKSYVSKILNNRAVIGELQMYESNRVGDQRKRQKLGDPIPNYFPVTVSFDLWRKAQAARASRKTNRSGRPSRELVNLFSGLCKCGECGGGMELRAKGDARGGDYLTCSRWLRRAGCSAAVSYPLGRLEDAFFAHWSGFFATAADFASSNSAEITDLAERLDRTEQTLRTARRHLDNLMNALSEAESADERRPIRAKSAEAQATLDNLTEQRGGLIRELEIAEAINSQASHDEMERVMQSALLVQDVGSRRRISQVLRQAVQEIIFRDGTASFRPVRGVGSLRIGLRKGDHTKVEFVRDWGVSSRTDEVL